MAAAQFVSERYYNEVFSKLTQRPEFFNDLVDPTSRSAADITGVAAILRDFEPSGPVTLALWQ